MEKCHFVHMFWLLPPVLKSTIIAFTDKVCRFIRLEESSAIHLM